MPRGIRRDEPAELADVALWEALGRGEALPAWWYTDPGVYALERERIFRRAWQYVGLTEQVARAGDFLTMRLGDVPVVVTRGEEGELRAFANVCRHRGSELVREEWGNRKTLQCHYHAWTYNLDGTLRAAPGMKDEPGFDAYAFSLVALPLETWGPFVFVNPDRNARSLREVLGSLPELTAASGVRLGDLRRRVRRTYDIAANWKVVVDNYPGNVSPAPPLARSATLDVLEDLRRPPVRISNFRLSPHLPPSIPLPARMP